ncbi:hypothetical protein WJX74_008563 [Apatococcus lobatus]|uniref:D-3-phosphoglycerate dehydrogenase n=1 Tax=Apatococcus lobatus TaxID=904363 RepID=A0AAW1QM04_9CHLO
MSSTAGPLKVLFCGQSFDKAFFYTKESLTKKNAMNIEVTRCSLPEVPEHAQQAHVVVPFMALVDRPLLQAAQSLRLIIQYGVGVEGVNIPAATAHGIWVSNIPSGATGNATSCAEHAIFLALACLKQVHAMAASVREQRIGLPTGETLFSKTALVIGYGGIARELVPRLQAFGTKLILVRRSSWEGDQPQTSGWDVHLASWKDLSSLLPQADLVFLTCSLNDETRGLVDSSFLSKCKPGVRIVNVARGGLLDYDAVLKELDGKIGALGLDVQWSEPFDPEDPVAKHSRVYLTPHVAGVTELSYRTMADLLAEQIIRASELQPPTVQLNQIDPSEWVRKHSARVSA